MSDSETDRRAAQLEPEVRDMKLEVEAENSGPESAGLEEDGKEPSAASPHKLPVKSRTQTPVEMERSSGSPVDGSEREEVVGGDITVKLEPGKAPKLARTTSHKVISRPPRLFLHYDDRTSEASGTFQVIEGCTYGNKSMGSTEHALECDCAEEWDPESKENFACGEDSDCINRATKMECVGDCGCGPNCQNQRFIKKQYASVTVIKTEKKGYGLRANADLKPNDFIFEYIGEVINEGAFRRRMVQYDEEGIKHFYFMSLSKGEFVDATKKGNLGRFCNHSCNPNCYVDKWVVGDKLRMGIFAERNIKAGEELVFNYNVDRYGADPQPCYCGEPNCTGYIGGKTQTERATKLSHTTIEALGIDDADGWDTAVAKRPRKKKISEDDEEYVNNVQPKSLDEGGVTKVMATLMQCKEKWIAVKLLSRIQRSDDEMVMNRVIRMHGYQILKTTLNNFVEDHNVALQILEIMDKMPRLSRNKIQNSNIEETVEKLKSCEDERVSSKASRLLYEWSQLKMEYRIPRVKRDPNAVVESRRTERVERQSKERSRSRSGSPEAPRGPSAPRNVVPARSFPGPPRTFRRPPQFNPLPPGWFMAQDENNKTYYYSAGGETTWIRPTMAAAQPPPPPKEKTHEQKLQDIIRSITENATPKAQTPVATTPQPESVKKEKRPGTEKWRSYSEDKQKKLYENTIFPHIRYVLDKFKHKLPKEDLKRFAKEISKKLVNSDFKNGRVQDPTKVSEKQERGVKKYCKDYLDKAVLKKKEHDKKRSERKSKEAPAAGSTTPPGEPGAKGSAETKENKADEDDEMLDISDNEMEHVKDGSPTESQTDRSESASKRKRDSETPNGMSMEEGDASSSKKLKTIDIDAPPPPPPPPPPPADGTTFDDNGDAIDDSEMANAADVSDSFHQEALQAIHDASADTPTDTSTSGDSQAQNGLSSQKNQAVKVELGDISGASPMQLATPSTNDSYDGSFEGMNPDRLRQLGVANGR